MLTKNQLETFIRDGFIVKKAVLTEESCKRCIDATWGVLEQQGFTKDRASWREAYSKKGVVKLRDEIVDDPLINQSIKSCEGVLSSIESLMGPGFTNCGVRGVYPTLPIPRRISRPYEPHIEVHPCQVVVMYYISDVQSRNGGLLVWPGSHRDVYLSHQKIFEFSPSNNFMDVFRKINLQRPVELTGSAGDVALFHHRLFHSGSNNFRDGIRFGILNDFIPQNYDVLNEELPNENNMWSYWSKDVQNVAENLDSFSPITNPKQDLGRKIFISAQRMLRRLKGGYLDEFEAKIARSNARTDGQ